MDQTELLLKRLTEVPGVPGYEHEVRRLIREALPPAVQVEQDKIGSLVARLEGSTPAPRLMLAAHMDEVGFMVRHITDEGFIKFVPLGGWWDQVLLAQRVIIKTYKGDVPGVIGAKPPHILPKEERDKLVAKRDMYIDIGATSRQEVEEAGVRLGDPVVPVSDFTILPVPKAYLGKAWDDRVGCALMVQALERLAGDSHPNTVYAAATVMEEVSLRGARTSVALVEPDVAVILESDIASDVPGIKPEECAIKLGKGPSLMLYDAMMIPNLKFRDLVIETAKELDIPLQLSTMEGGATDGGYIHVYRTGVPTVVIGVPARHIHSHVGIIHRTDYDHALELVVALAKRLDAGTVASFLP